MSEREDHHHVGVRAAQLDQGLLGVGVGEGGGEGSRGVRCRSPGGGRLGTREGTARPRVLPKAQAQEQLPETTILPWRFSALNLTRVTLLGSLRREVLDVGLGGQLWHPRPPARAFHAHVGPLFDSDLEPGTAVLAL